MKASNFLAYFKRLPDKKNSKWQHVFMHFRTFTQGKTIGVLE